MRSTILAALTMTTLALAACAGEEPAPQPPPAPPPAPPAATTSATPADATPPPPVKPSLAELVPQTCKGISDAFNAHDAQKLASYYTDDAAVSGYGEGPPTHSRAEVQKGVEQMFQMFGDAKSVPTRIWVKGNVVAVEMAWAGTMNNDVMGMKATHKPIGGMRLHIMWFTDDGLVKEQHEYGDEAGLMAQMKGQKGAPPVPTLPTNPPEMHIAKGTPDEDKLADFGKSVGDAFSKDDPKGVVALLADDADYWMNFTGMPATKGKKDLTKEVGALFKSFPDQKWTMTNAWGIDGYAIVEHSMSGTFKGAFGPVKPTGKPVSGWHQVDIVQPTADGKVQHGWSYANALEMMMQSGAFKPPGEKAVADKGGGGDKPAADKAGAAPKAAAAKAPKKK